MGCRKAIIAIARITNNKRESAENESGCLAREFLTEQIIE